MSEGVLHFIFLILAGRALGPEEFGFYGYILSILMFALVVTNWGLPTIVVRELAQRPEAETHIFASMFRVRATFAVVFFISMLTIIFLQPLESTHQLAVVLIFLYLLFVPFDIAPVFDAHKLSRWDVPGKLAGRIASVALLFTLWMVKGSLNVVDVAACSSLLMLVNVVIAWRIAQRLGFALRPFAAAADTRKLFRVSAYVMWGNLMLTTYLYSQTILVKWFSTLLETGYYSMSSRLLMPFFITKAILYRLLLPIISEAANDHKVFTERLQRILPALTLIFAPLVALGIPAIKIFLVPLFGQDYAGAILPFQIGLSHFVLTGAGSLYGTALLAAGDQRTPAWGLTIGCAAGVGVSFLLIPHYGATGGAWAAFTAAIISAAFPAPFFFRRWRLVVGWRILRIILSSLAGTAAFYALTYRETISEIGALAVSVVVIVAGLWLSGEISKTKLDSLLSTFKKSTQEPET
ncbi:oligosaccharide flippase family protein [bacterium]|nr:oligosaccharide flippase family protein [bacterium]